MKKSKLLFLCKNRSNEGYGNGHIGLINSAVFVSEALQPYFDTIVEVCIDGNSIDKFVSQHKPDYAIIEALWATPDKLKQLVRLHPKVTWVVRLHSKMPFLANEGIALDWCGQYQEIPNVYLCGNNKEFVDDMYKSGYSCIYLPNIYMMPPYPSSHKRSSNLIDISCLGAIRPMKNTLIQAVAAISFAGQIDKYLRFHVNASRVEQKGENTLKNLRALFNQNKDVAELIEHDWMSQQDLNMLISRMDIGMQVSYSESYNLIAAQHINNDIPIVTSDEVEINTSWLHADPNSSNDIESKLFRAYRFGGTLGVLSKHKLDNSNKEAIKEWVSTL
jgi:hypothetical protein